MLEALQTIHETLIQPERLVYVIPAIILTAVIGAVTGAFAGNAHPLMWQITDKVFGQLGDRLDKKGRAKGDLILRGFLITVAIIILTYVVMIGGGDYIKNLPYAPAGEILLLTFTLSCGTVWYSLLKLYFAMEKNEVGKGAYYAIARTARTNLATADDYGITRAGMGLAARSFDKALVAPVFWYILFGLPGAFIYSALAATAWRFGKDGFSSGFGTIPLVLERLMGFVPSMLAGILISVASIPTATASITKSVTAWFGHKNRAAYEAGGFPLTAMAWALNVTLGGSSQDLSGSAIKAGWVGPDKATAKLSHAHLRRAILIHFIAALLFIATLSGAFMWSELLLDF